MNVQALDDYSDDIWFTYLYCWATREVLERNDESAPHEWNSLNERRKEQVMEDRQMLPARLDVSFHIQRVSANQSESRCDNAAHSALSSADHMQFRSKDTLVEPRKAKDYAVLGKEIRTS